MGNVGQLFGVIEHDLSGTGSSRQLFGKDRDFILQLLNKSCFLLQIN